jgi:DNA-3-methyladenine glycosylase I
MSRGANATSADRGPREPLNGAQDPATSALPRCNWPGISDPVYRRYHDEEWGTPVHRERRLFEFLVLEGAQAGLSWRTILHRRPGYRRAFAGFHIRTVAAFGPERLDALMGDPGIVRNRRKILSAVQNARCVVRLQEEGGSLERMLWDRFGGRTKVNHWTDLGQIPSRTPESDELSRDLRRAGFSFVGPTICYALAQATGMVNDHVVGCFRHPDFRPVRRGRSPGPVGPGRDLGP